MRPAAWQVLFGLVVLAASGCVSAITVVNATTSDSDPPVLNDGEEVVAVSSTDGPVFFKIIESDPDVSAVIRVTNRDTHINTVPTAVVSAVQGSSFRTIGAFREETKDNPALLDISVCDYGTGEWIVAVEYYHQQGAGSSPTSRAFNIRFHTEGGLSCELEETLVIVGIPSLILACLVAFLICWYCKKKKQPPVSRRASSAINDRDFANVGARQRQGARRQDSSRDLPSERDNRASITLADQMAALAAAQQRVVMQQYAAQGRYPQQQVVMMQGPPPSGAVYGAGQGVELPPVSAAPPQPTAPRAPQQVATGVYRR